MLTYAHTPTVLDLRNRRSGCVLYQKRGDDVDFLFARDTRTGDSTDFGGSPEVDDDGHRCIIAALRELYEESYEVMNLKLDDVIECKCPIVYNDRSFIIFVPTNIDLFRSNYNSKKRTKLGSRCETNGTVVCSWTKLNAYLSGERSVDLNLYTAPRDLLIESRESIQSSIVEWPNV